MSEYVAKILIKHFFSSWVLRTLFKVLIRITHFTLLFFWPAAKVVERSPSAGTGLVSWFNVPWIFSLDASYLQTLSSLLLFLVLSRSLPSSLTRRLHTRNFSFGLELFTRVISASIIFLRIYNKYSSLSTLSTFLSLSSPSALSPVNTLE